MFMMHGEGKLQHGYRMLLETKTKGWLLLLLH
jgi:hypothetical protein